MQALRPSVFLAYAAEDRETARRIAGFLDRGADVTLFFEEGELAPGQDLAAKALEACMADIAIVLFSRHSLPSRWPRAQWENALVTEPAARGVRMAFVKCGDCVPPKVLSPLFELNALRELKRWVRGNDRVPRAARRFDPDVEILGIAIADRAGVDEASSETAADEFVRCFHEDFDAVVRLDCGARTKAALAGDMAAQLGLTLTGEAADNWERLREFCFPRRVLVVLKDAQAGFEFDGRTSTLLVPGEVTEPDDDSLRGIQHALREPTLDWTEICRLARQGRRITRDAGRLAECHELMEEWRRLAESQGDLEALDEASRELIWILEGWNRPEEAGALEFRRASECEQQMLFPF